jgi:hypothetical protein
VSEQINKEELERVESLLQTYTNTKINESKTETNNHITNSINTLNISQYAKITEMNSKLNEKLPPAIRKMNLVTYDQQLTSLFPTFTLQNMQRKLK